MVKNVVLFLRTSQAQIRTTVFTLCIKIKEYPIDMLSKYQNRKNPKKRGAEAGHSRYVINANTHNI